MMGVCMKGSELGWLSCKLAKFVSKGKAIFIFTSISCCLRYISAVAESGNWASQLSNFPRFDLTERTLGYF